MKQLGCASLGKLLASIVLAIGIIVAACLMAKAIYNIKAQQRYMVVKGLHEKNVDANLALWEINFSETGDDLVAVNDRVDQDRQKIAAFLQQQGFSADEWEAGPVKVTDRLANIYGPVEANKSQPRYIIASSVRVRTVRVDLVQKAVQQSSQLAKVALPLNFESGNLSPNPSYIFTGLDGIRPEMLSAATNSARTVAEQLVKDLGGKIGPILWANQGLFQILSRDAAEASGDWRATQDELSSIHKKVRVVTTIHYMLKQ